MTPAELIQLGEAMHRELGREYYLTGAGLKREATFQTIYDKYAALLTGDALAAARAACSGPVVEWIVGVRAGRLVAPLEERQLAWEQSAVVQVAGRAVPYLRVPIELSNEPDRAARLALDRERAQLVADQLNPLRREWFLREHAALAGFILGGAAHRVPVLLDGVIACAAALVLPSGREHVSEGTLRGYLIREPRGSGGFGYDPIFVPEGGERTTAELSAAEKDAISHRGRAFRGLAPVIAAVVC